MSDTSILDYWMKDIYSVPYCKVCGNPNVTGGGLWYKDAKTERACSECNLWLYEFFTDRHMVYAVCAGAL